MDGFNNYKDQRGSQMHTYYSENYKPKKGTKYFSVLQMGVIAVLSSMLGGLIIGGLLLFVKPSLLDSGENPNLNSEAASTLESGLNGNTSNNAISDSQKKTDAILNTVSNYTISDIAARVSPSIVGIRVTAPSSGYFFEQINTPSEGSGVIIRSDGYIVTNFHVVAEALDNNYKMTSGASIEVILPSNKDKAYKATIVGLDSRTDLAVIKISATGLPVAALGNSDKLKVGEPAIAIGNPAGLEYMGSVTAGIISGLNRTIPMEGIKDLKLIQTDAAINPGNSGGALVDADAKIIGINNAKMGGNGFEGLGFAIPINKVKEITSALIENKYVPGRPFLGITYEDRYTSEYAKANNLPEGVMVRDILPSTGAYLAGIKIGDIITTFDGVRIKTFDELNARKNLRKPGDKAILEIYRDYKYIKITVELGEDKGSY